MRTKPEIFTKEEIHRCFCKSRRFNRALRDEVLEVIKFSIENE